MSIHPYIMLEMSAKDFYDMVLFHAHQAHAENQYAELMRQKHSHN